MDRRSCITALVGFIGVVIAAALATALVSFLSPFLGPLDEYIYSRYLPLTRGHDSRFILVLIDDQTLAHYRSHALSRSTYAQVIHSVLRGKPQVVGVDIFFDGLRDPQQDSALLDVLNAADASIILATYPQEFDSLIIQQASRAFPDRQYTFPRVGVGDAQVFTDSWKAGITRVSTVPFRIPALGLELLPFPIMVAAQYLKADYRQIPLAGRLLVAQVGEMRIPTSGGMLINYLGGREAFDVVPFENVSAVDPEIFRDKLVLIGTVAAGMGDRHVTPLSQDTPGIIIHANAIHTIISGRLIRAMDATHLLILTFLICAISGGVTIGLGPRWGLGASISLALSIAPAANWVLREFHTRIEYLPLLLGIIAASSGTAVWQVRTRHDAKKGGLSA